ncbi:hypothetical protein ACWDTT_25085 [Streptosporangium sandarakinum]
MTSAETTFIRVAAARNNADWCASVCRSHGIPNTFSETAWHSARRTPPYYPDAVTLHPDAVPTDFLSEIDTASPGCSIKDSFAALDLTSDGFVKFFTAQWIHRPAETHKGNNADPAHRAGLHSRPAPRLAGHLARR